MFQFLIWTSLGIFYIFFRVLRYTLCLIVLNIAAVTNNVSKCINLMAFTMCNASDYGTACFLFIH